MSLACSVVPILTVINTRVGCKFEEYLNWCWWLLLSPFIVVDKLKSGKLDNFDNFDNFDRRIIDPNHWTSTYRHGNLTEYYANAGFTAINAFLRIVLNRFLTDSLCLTRISRICNKINPMPPIQFDWKIGNIAID